MPTRGNEECGGKAGRPRGGCARFEGSKFPLRRADPAAREPLPEEVARLRAENERLTQELVKSNSDLLRIHLAWDREQRDRADAEHRWHGSLQAFTRWFDTAAIPMTCVAADGEILRTNGAALDLLGYSREDYTQRRLTEIVIEDEVARSIQAAAAGGRIPDSRATRVRCSNGSLKPVLISCRPFEQGLDRGICCYLQDMSEIDDTRARQRKSENLFRQLAENIREVFWMTTVDKSEMLYISPAYEQVWQASCQSLYDHPQGFLDSIHPDDRGRVIAHLPRQAQEGGYCQEYRIIRPDGSSRWIRDRAFPVRDDAGRVYRIAGIAEDITQIKAAERSLAGQARRQQALADLGRRAVEKTSLHKLLEDAVRCVSETLDAEFAEVLELRRSRNDFLLCTAIGWPEEMIGRATFPAGPESEPGFALQSDHPVVVDNLRAERRFAGLPLLLEHEVHSGMSVIIGRRRAPFGVLSVHTAEARRFSADDLSFLQAAGTLLGAAVERNSAEERQEMLSIELMRQRQRVDDVLKNVPGVVWELRLDPETGKLLVGFVSDYVEQMLGFPRQQFIDHPDLWMERLHPDDLPRVKAKLQETIATGQPCLKSFRWIARDGRILWVESREQLFYDEKGNLAGIRGVTFDVTLQKEAEKERAAVEERFRAFMDNSPILAFIKDRQGRYIYGNRAFDQLVSGLRKDWLRKDDWELFPAEVAAPLRAHDDQMWQAGMTTESMEITYDPDGRLMYWMVFRFPLKEQHGIDCLGGVAIDITERRRLEQEVLEISEQEKRRIGQDLHDGLCQHLLGLAMMSQSLADRMAGESREEAGTAQDISRFLYDAVALARGLMRGLHLVGVEAGGLVSALDEFSQTTSRLFSKRCSVETDVEVKVTDNSVATQIFRIAQEATHNAIKHANADEVKIRLTRRDSALVVTVEHDGAGFPAVLPTTGIGLQTMKYRADLIGATLEFRNRPEGGGVVECALPLRPEIHLSNRYPD